MTELRTWERNSLIILAVLCLIVILYGAITFQWGIVYSFISLIIPVFLILVILIKIVEYFRASQDLNQKLVSNVESLKESVSEMKEEITEIKEITKDIAGK
jgi:ABC-type transport system involved in cytochrome bd biosynthesis fused ATPase/permease subunit